MGVVKYQWRVLLVAVSSFALYGANTSHAADQDAAPDPNKLEEIVVTAQRVAEPVGKVPLAISTFSGNDLAKRNYLSVDDFKGAVPGLQVNNYVGEARFNIRGIGLNSLSFGVDSQISLNVNGVYSSNSFASDLAFLDISRIEVVRGPQGTLYGRNATGGAINIITNKPTDNFEGSAQIGIGNYDAVTSQVIVSGPIMDDKILGRLAFSTTNHDGYSKNLFDGKYYDDANDRAVRGTLLFNFTDDVTLNLVADYYRESDGANAAHLFGTSPGYPILTGVVLGGMSTPLNANGQAINPRVIDNNTIPNFQEQGGGILGELNWHIDDALSLKSITSYRQTYISFPLDFDQTSAAFPSGVPAADFEGYDGDQQVSEEVQLIGDLGWIKWVSGLYYFHDNVDPAYFQFGLNLGTVTAPFIKELRLGGTTATDAYATFGQVTVTPTDNLHITAGLRYSYERRASTSLEEIPALGVTVTDAASANFHDLSPKFSIDYQWTDDLMTYVTISKGFQSGGFDISAQPPLRAFQPETVWDYEGGVKWRGKQTSADLSVFHYDYSNLQVAQIVNGLPNTVNAATSTIDGVELTVTVEPVSDVVVTTALAYLDPKFTKFTENDTLTGLPTDLAGHQLPGSAAHSSNINIAYYVPLGSNELSFNGEWNWVDRVYFTEFNSAQVSQPPTSTFNAAARFTYGDHKWYAELYGKNLTDKLIASQKWITGAGFGSMVIGDLAPPRTFGVVFHYSFD